MTIHKGIVVPFLPCLVAFWGFHPYMFFHFFKCFFVTCIWRITIFHNIYKCGLTMHQDYLRHYHWAASKEPPLVIGASLSEPHTSHVSGAFSLNVCMNVLNIVPHIRCSHNLTLCNLILQFQFLALSLSSWISRVSTTRTYKTRRKTTGFSLAMGATKAQTTSSKGTTESCRLTRWDRLGCSEWLIDLPMRLLRREKPGYSLTEYWWGFQPCGIGCWDCWDCWGERGQATVWQSTGEAQTTTGHAGTAPFVATIFYPN